MKLARLRGVSLIAAGVLTLGLGQLSSYASAATSKSPAPSAISNGNQSLKVSPLRTDVTVGPGATGKVQTFVTNVTSTPMIIQPIENDFVAGDEKGTPSIILDSNSYAPTHSLKRFMVSLQNVIVAPGATQEVDVTITVPRTAQAGGYYGAIRFAPMSNSSQPVSLTSSVASLILLTVPGPTVEQLTLTNFDVQQNGGTSSNFRTSNDLSLMLRFQNKGNLQEAPFGQIYVQKDKKVINTYNFNQQDPKGEILPDSARRWVVPLKGLGKFGKYTVGATFTYGAKGQAIEITKTIWIIPTTVIMIGVIGLLVIVAIGIGFWMFIRSYKRKILRSSRRRY